MFIHRNGEKIHGRTGLKSNDEEERLRLTRKHPGSVADFQEPSPCWIIAGRGGVKVKPLAKMFASRLKPRSK